METADKKTQRFSNITSNVNTFPGAAAGRC